MRIFLTHTSRCCTLYLPKTSATLKLKARNPKGFGLFALCAQKLFEPMAGAETGDVAEFASFPAPLVEVVIAGSGDVEVLYFAVFFRQEFRR
jgi:hypothetical protein